MPVCVCRGPAAHSQGHLGSHTSPVGFGFGVLIALSLLVFPGAIVARIARLAWPTAIAVGPALTYGTVALAIVPFGALGIPWTAWTALPAFAVMTGTAFCLRMALGVLLGAVLIGVAAVRGIPQWQSIPSTWDAIWHANTIRFIVDTG